MGIYLNDSILQKYLHSGICFFHLSAYLEKSLFIILYQSAQFFLTYACGQQFTCSMRVFCKQISSWWTFRDSRCLLSQIVLPIFYRLFLLPEMNSPCSSPWSNSFSSLVSNPPSFLCLTVLTSWADIICDVYTWYVSTAVIRQLHNAVLCM